jgi:hypothetical protein
VKMDDAGLWLARTGRTRAARALGRGMVRAMPPALRLPSAVGTRRSRTPPGGRVRRRHGGPRRRWMGSWAWRSGPRSWPRWPSCRAARSLGRGRGRVQGPCQGPCKRLSHGA